MVLWDEYGILALDAAALRNSYRIYIGTAPPFRYCMFSTYVIDLTRLYKPLGKKILISLRSEGTCIEGCGKIRARKSTKSKNKKQY